MHTTKKLDISIDGIALNLSLSILEQYLMHNVINLFKSSLFHRKSQQLSIRALNDLKEKKKRKNINSTNFLLFTCFFSVIVCLSFFLVII